MAKQKKKRTKKYTGQDAAVTRPTITRVTAVKRNKAQLWWLERRRFLRPTLITIAVAAAIIWLVIELVRVASGGAL